MYTSPCGWVTAPIMTVCITHVVMQWLAGINMTCLPHTLCSPHITPFCFFLFPFLKLCMQGKHFQLEVVKGVVVMCDGFFFFFAFETCHHCWDKLLAKKDDKRDLDVV